MLCSGNGQYSRGRCQCYSGWKGTECDVPSNQCVDIHCGGHGVCIVGACICNTGYKGDNCEEGRTRDPPRMHTLRVVACIARLCQPLVINP